MAVIFQQSISESIPINAFNNNVAIFTSDTQGVSPRKATIKIDDLELVITPDSQGVFNYNFKRFFKTQINTNNFADGITNAVFAYDQSTPQYVFNDLFVFKDIEVEFKITQDDDTEETITKTYGVLRSIVQLEDYRRSLTNESNTDIALLIPFVSNDNLKYHASYFEGYPFDIPLYSNEDRQVTVKHVGTGNSTVVNVKRGVNRLFISNGDTNWSFEDVLPLHTGVNELEFNFTGMARPKTKTLYLNKKQGLCGTYLKWFNQLGGWSYFLFNTYKVDRKTKSLGSFKNGGRIISRTSEENISIGVSSKDELTVFYSGISVEEKGIVNTLFDSPKMYRYLNDVFQNASASDWLVETIKTGATEIYNKNLNIYEEGFVINKAERYKMTL